MKHMKKLAALILALTLTLSLAACGGKTPEEAVRASQEKVNAAKSMAATMQMDMEMTAQGQTVPISTTMDMVYFSDPIQMKATMDMDMGGMGGMSMEMYAQAEGEKYVLYLTDGTQWMSQEMALEELQAYDARGSMDLYLTSASSFKADGTEKLAGGDADKYSGVISGESMEEVMQSSGALDAMSQLVGDSTDLKDMYKDLGDIPVTIWVDKKSGYPVRYTMDMSAVMTKMMEKMLALDSTTAELGIEVTKMEIVMDCFDFDAVEPFTIPQEALDSAA